MQSRVCLLAAIVALPFLGQAAWANKVYVSNEKDNTVTVVDSATMEVVKTIEVGQRPRGITISPDGKIIAVRTRSGAVCSLAGRQNALHRQ